jgi:hypothetical protein
MKIEDAIEVIRLSSQSTSLTYIDEYMAATRAIELYVSAQSRWRDALMILYRQAEQAAKSAQAESEAVLAEIIELKARGKVAPTFAPGDIVTYAHEDGLLYLARVIEPSALNEYSIESRCDDGVFRRTSGISAARLSSVPSAYVLLAGQFENSGEAENVAPKKRTPGWIIDRLFAQVDEKESEAFADFMREVIVEVARAMQLHPTVDVLSTAIGEEFGELCKALMDEPYANVRKEAVQLAATCARIVVQGDRSQDLHRAIKGHDPLPGSPYVAGPNARLNPSTARLSDVICGAMRTHTPDKGHLDEYIAECVVIHMEAT